MTVRVLRDASERVEVVARGAELSSALLKVLFYGYADADYLGARLLDDADKAEGGFARREKVVYDEDAVRRGYIAGCRPKPCSKR